MIAPSHPRAAVPGHRLTGSGMSFSPVTETRPALVVDGLVKSFAGQTVLRGVSFRVAPGELLAVLGANGSGKSTALRCVMGLIAPDSGSVELDGRCLDDLRGGALRRARRPAAMVFQKIHLVGRRSALDNVCAGALARVPVRQSWSPLLFPTDLREEAMACLDRVGLVDKALQRVRRMSGGQQQRVAVARALCQRASVLLADEPVSALDPVAAEQVMSLLAELAHKEGLAVAAVLHQPELARRHADRVLGLLNGAVVIDKPVARLHPTELDPLYLPSRATRPPAGDASDDQQGAR